MRNPFEMDLDEDEDGEVTLPPGYRPPAQRAMGATPMTTNKVIRQQEVTPRMPDNGAGDGSVPSADPPAPVPSEPALRCPPCPSCPGAPVPGGRMRSPDGSLLGLVIGLGLLGGVAYYAAKQLSPMGEYEEEEDEETTIASLPSRIPRMLAANSDVIDAEFVEVDEEG